MRELIDHLSQKERRVLSLLGILLLGSLLFYFFVASMEKSEYFRSRESYSSLENEVEKIKSEQKRIEEEWQMWKEALEDMIFLKDRYFYKETDGVPALRRDLQRIFNSARISVSSIKYDYIDLADEKIKKVKVSFDVTGTYFLIKKFIHSVEMFPKFLVIERIDFLNIDTQSGGFKLSISLAAYYES